MRKAIRVAAATAAAALLAVSAPLVAQADPAQYTPLKPDKWAATIHSGATFTHLVPGNTFDSDSRLHLSVTGTSPAPTLALFTASQFSSALVSDEAGGADITLRFGATAQGAYDVTVIESGTGNVSSGVVTVIPDSAATTHAMAALA